jgi:hypothetical protein
MTSGRWPEDGPSSQGLLADNDEFKPSPSLSTESLVHKGEIPTKKWRSWVSLHVILISLYSTIYLGLVLYGPHFSVGAKQDTLPCNQPHDSNITNSDFGAGHPRPELEEAWHSLLQSEFIAPTFYELKTDHILR